MKQPEKPRPVKTAEENRRRSSVFRSASPLIRTAKQNRDVSPVKRLSKKKITMGGNFSVTLGVVLVVCALFVVVVGPPIYNLVSQIEQRNKVHGQLTAAQEQEKQLKEELDLLDDPDHVAAQARERLGYVKPGETRYTVADPGEEYQSAEDRYNEKIPDRPWFLEIANTSRLAGLSDGNTGKDQGLSSEATPAPGATKATEGAK